MEPPAELQVARSHASPPRISERERGLRRRIIEAGDTARRQLARELHDGAQRHFAAAVSTVRRAEESWSSDPATARQLLDASVRRAEAGLEALRDMAIGIHPPILTHFGLGSAIEAFASTLSLPVSVEAPAVRLPAALEASVYFFVWEALTNVVEHARASAATVRVAVARQELRAEVRDDGIGGADLAGSRGGLLVLADRVAAFDGRVTISSPRGLGTTVRATFPL
jgi:signal transduction histidine kinase